MTEEVPTSKEQRDQFKNRRKMAWVALLSIIGVTLIAFFLPVDRLTAISDLLSWFYTTMTAVTMGYMGTATIEHFRKQ